MHARLNIIFGHRGNVGLGRVIGFAATGFSRQAPAASVPSLINPFSGIRLPGGLRLGAGGGQKVPIGAMSSHQTLTIDGSSRDSPERETDIAHLQLRENDRALDTLVISTFFLTSEHWI